MLIILPAEYLIELLYENIKWRPGGDGGNLTLQYCNISQSSGVAPVVDPFVITTQYRINRKPHSIIAVGCERNRKTHDGNDTFQTQLLELNLSIGVAKRNSNRYNTGQKSMD